MKNRIVVCLLNDCRQSNMRLIFICYREKDNYFEANHLLQRNMLSQLTSHMMRNIEIYSLVNYPLILVHSPSLNHLHRRHHHSHRSHQQSFLRHLDNVLYVIVANVVVPNRMDL